MSDDPLAQPLGIGLQSAARDETASAEDADGRYDPEDAERQAYQWLAGGGGRPPPEMVFALLERCAVPPSVMELAVRAVGVMHTPWMARGLKIEPTLVYSYARAVYHEAGAAPYPEPGEVPDEPVIDPEPYRPPPPEGPRVPPSVARIQEVARSAFPRRSRGFGAQLERWRETAEYGEAVQSLRTLREGLEIARSMHRMQRELERVADNRAAKTKFFIRLLKRAARRRKRMQGEL